jgi:hypothetical protein
MGREKCGGTGITHGARTDIWRSLRFRGGFRVARLMRAPKTALAREVLSGVGGTLESLVFVVRRLWCLMGR